MVKTSIAALAVIGVAVSYGPAQASLQNFVDGCADQQSTAAEVVNFCRQAVETGQLPPVAEAQVRTNLGVGLFDLSRFSEAIEEYSRAIAIDPGLLVAYLNRARAHEKRGDLRSAAADYAEVIRRNPNMADAYLGRGAMLLSNGDPARAVSDLSRAIELSPEWISPHFNRGMAYLRLQEPARAALDFSTVIQRNPNDAGAFLNRGRARSALGMNNAVADFDKAIDLAPDWGGAWFARGQHFDLQGNIEAANSDFLRANELGYPDPWLLDRIRQISG